MILATLLAAATAHGQAAPPSVRAFIARRAGCDHWGGEEPFDAHRGREIARAVRKLRCDRLDRDETALRRRFHKRPAILRLLGDTAGAID